MEELGGDGPLVDHAARLERDDFDPVFDHLLLIDRAATRRRLTMWSASTGCCRATGVPRAGASIPRRIRPDGRCSPLAAGCWNWGGPVCIPTTAAGRRCSTCGTGWRTMCWTAGSRCCSASRAFTAPMSAALAQPLSWLHHHHLAPRSLRVRARPTHRQAMDLMPADALDRRAAMAGDAGADQGLSAPGRLRRRRGLDRPCVQHHRCLSGDGHRADVGRATASSTPARRAGGMSGLARGAEMALPRPAPAWLAAGGAARARLLAALTYGGLVLLLLVRLVERAAVRAGPAGDALHHPVRLPHGAA